MCFRCPSSRRSMRSTWRSANAVIEGEIKGRDAAKQAYEAAKDAGQKASLVEQERPNIFTNSVANIGPHEADRRPHRVSGDGEAGRRRLFAALPAGRRAPLQSQGQRDHARRLRRQAFARRSGARPRPHHPAGARPRQVAEDQSRLDRSDARCRLRARRCHQLLPPDRPEADRRQDGDAGARRRQRSRRQGFRAGVEAEGGRRAADCAVP